MHPDELDDLIRRSDDHVGAEPWENRPDAVRDLPRGLPPMHCPSCSRFGNEDDMCVVGDPCPDEECDGIIEWTYPRPPSGDGWDIIRDDEGRITIWTVETEWLNARQMVALAHAILSEVEIATNKEAQP